MSNKKNSTTEVSLSLPNALPVPRMHNSSLKRSFVTRLVARPTNDISIQFQVPGYCFLLKETDRITVTFCKHQGITVFLIPAKFHHDRIDMKGNIHQHNLTDLDMG